MDGKYTLKRLKISQRIKVTQMKKSNRYPYTPTKSSNNFKFANPNHWMGNRTAGVTLHGRMGMDGMNQL